MGCVMTFQERQAGVKRYSSFFATVACLARHIVFPRLFRTVTWDGLIPIGISWLIMLVAPISRSIASRRRE